MNNSEMPTSSEMPINSDIELNDEEAWHKEILFELYAKSRAKGAEYNYDFLEDAPGVSGDCRYVWNSPSPHRSSSTRRGSNLSTDSDSLEISVKQTQFSNRSFIYYGNNSNHP